DPSPARLNTPETLGMFRLFSELIAFHIDANDKLAHSQASLLDERRVSELRDQFIAVLGHDLRNPLASIDAGIKMLTRSGLDGKAAEVARLMQSSVDRMNALIGDVLDLARGKLGGGLLIGWE